MPPFAYDVFISYSSHDAAWVRGDLLPGLEQRGLRVCIDYRDFVPGTSSVMEMERAVLTSRHTLLVLTPDYLRSAWTEFETLLLQTHDPANRQRSLIPLLHTPCDVPLRLNVFTRVDFTVTQDWERLRSALGPALSHKTPDEIPLDAIPAPATLPPGSLMELRANPDFVGREHELRELARLLKGGTTTAISPAVAATGLGGIGKTQLACEFAHRYGQFFAGVFWLNCENADAVPAQIAQCGGAAHLDLRPNFAALPFEDQVGLVLQAWQGDLPYLLVFDNCEEEGVLQQWGPHTGVSRVLVTSRRARWSRALGVELLPLDTLPRAESIALLRTHRPDLGSEDSDLDALADYLGDLPLALHIAGSYLALYKDDLTPAEYLAELQVAGGIDAELLVAEDISPTGHDQSVLRTFQRSYDRLSADAPTDALALRLLARAAYCAPGAPLPRALLLATAGIDPGDTQATRPATRALQRLSALGLVEIADAGAVRLHRLLAAFVRIVTIDGVAQADVEQTLLVVARRLNQAGDPRLLHNIETHLRTITDTAIERGDKRAAALCNELGYHLDLMGNYTGARPYFERALAIWEAVLGIMHPDTAQVLNNLGYLLQSQGDYVGARSYFERALAIRVQVLGEQHRDIAQSLNNLGSLLQSQGDYVGARLYFERALAIWEAVLGIMHPDTAQVLNNLGHLLQVQDDYAGARSYFERALAIRVQVLGGMHPDTAQSLNNLGAMLQLQGDYAGARLYLERALAIWEAVLGAMHPDTAPSLNNLGALLHAQGDYAGAQLYFERALAIRVEVLGEHPATATSLNNLGHLLQAQGNYTGARLYFERALHIVERVLGPEHPDTRNIRRDLAALDTRSPSVEEEIAQVEQRAGVAVERVRAGGTIGERADVQARLITAADTYAMAEQADSPYRVLADRLRAMAASLEQTE